MKFLQQLFDEAECKVNINIDFDKKQIFIKYCKLIKDNANTENNKISTNTLLKHITKSIKRIQSSQAINKDLKNILYCIYKPSNK